MQTLNLEHNGNSRQVELTTGETTRIEFAPGEQLRVTPEALQTMEFSQSGENLTVRFADGSEAELVGYLASATPTLIVTGVGSVELRTIAPDIQPAAGPDGDAIGSGDSLLAAPSIASSLDDASAQTPLQAQGTRDYVRGVEFSEDPQLVAAADTGGDSVVPPTPNVPPQAKNDAAELNEHTSIDIDVLSNDIDPEGGPLTITDLSDPANGSATLNPDDSIHYEPDAHYVGNDSFTYTVNDEDGASSTATVNILIVPTMPDAVADSAYSNGAPVTIDILANDTGLQDGPLIVVAGDGANGTVTIDPITHHAIYTPSPHFVGVDTFYYKVFDSHFDYSATSVTVTVAALVANDDDPSDIAGFSGDSTVIFNVLDNDTGIDDQPLVLVAADGDNGVTSILNDLTIGYRPSADFSGDDSFLYKVFDADYDHDSAKVDVNGVLSGSETDDADLTGSAGNDILFGLGGNDTLDGGEGTDAVLGGAGDDVLIFDANDSFLDGGSGVDTLSLNWDDGSLDELLTKIDNIEQAELNTAGANGEQSYLLSDTGISSLSLSDGVISIDNSGNATNSDGITGLNFAQLSGGVSVFADVPIDAVFV